MYVEHTYSFKVVIVYVGSSLLPRSITRLWHLETKISVLQHNLLVGMRACDASLMSVEQSSMEYQSFSYATSTCIWNLYVVLTSLISFSTNISNTISNIFLAVSALFFAIDIQ